MGIQVPPDDTGKIVETFTPNTDHRQVVTLGDDTATTRAAVGANGLEVDVQASVLPTGASTSSLQTNLVDTNNSSVATLGISATFTGTGTDVTGYGSVSVQVFADQSSATDGLSLEWSTDNTNWDVQDQHTVTLNIGQQFIIPRAAQFFRLVYTNGGTGQTAFRLETILNRYGVSGEIEELNTALAAEDLALSTRAVIAGETPGGAYTNVQVSTAGNFKVDVEEINGVAVSVDQGVGDAGTQRVILANDEPLPAGTNNIGDVDVLSSALPTGAATSANQLADDHNVTVSNASLAITAAALPLPAGAATSALQLANGHDVTVDNAGAGAAVNIQDGGNVISIDTPADATDGGTHGASQTGFRAMGTDGTNDQQIQVTAGGQIEIHDGGNTITIDAAALPLPAGAATSAGQLADGHNVVVTSSGLPTGAATSANQLADDHNVTVSNASLAITAAALPLPSGAATSAAQLADGHGVAAAGDVAHDTTDSGNPVKIGHQAAEFGAEPPTVSADSDRVNSIASPQGIQYVLGGHPNIISREFMTNDGETNTDMLGAVAAGSHIVLMGIECLVDDAVTATVQVRAGFGTASVPAEPASGAGVNGVVLSHPGLAAGSGVVRGGSGGILAVGGSDEELRVTCGAPTTGQINFIISYYVATL